MDAIVEVESGGNVKAVNGICAGPMQISPVLVRQCNQILKEQKSKKRYTLRDRYSLDKSKEMFLLIQQACNPERSIEWAVRAWNGGPKYSIKATNRYYRKVLAAMDR